MIGFGLSNDERRGAVADFVPAFRIAAAAGLCPSRTAASCPAPPASGPASTSCTPTASGTAWPRPRDPGSLDRLAAAGITLEVCPSSNVALGVAATPADVPLRALIAAGIPVALGADDPLLFGPRLTAQYEIARQAHGLTDDQLAELARMSVHGSAAPGQHRARLLAGIDAWLRPGPQLSPAGPALGSARSRG